MLYIGKEVTVTDAMVTGRMPERKKQQGLRVLKRDGMNASQAVNLLFDRLIEEGNRDGSIHTEYAKEIAELLPLLTSLWLLPSVFPATKEEMRRKFSFIGAMMEKMGVPLFDDTIQRLVDEFFEQIPDLK